MIRKILTSVLSAVFLVGLVYADSVLKASKRFGK